MKHNDKLFIMQINEDKVEWEAKYRMHFECFMETNYILDDACANVCKQIIFLFCLVYYQHCQWGFLFSGYTNTIWKCIEIHTE